MTIRQRRLIKDLKNCSKRSNGSNHGIVCLAGRTGPCAESRCVCRRLVVTMLAFVEDGLGGRNPADPDDTEDYEHCDESLPTTNHKSQPRE